MQAAPRALRTAEFLEGICQGMDKETAYTMAADTITGPISKQISHHGIRSVYEVIPDEDKPSSDTTEHTPFSLACAVGDLDMAQFLYYEAGCTNDAARSNDLGFTPFRFACMNDHRKVVSWLFKIKAVPPR